MSSQSLRELLAAELAALSDCDDAELTDEDPDLYAASYDGTVAGEDGLFSRDVTDETKSLDEWQLLIQSSEQAERRFEGMRLSLNDHFSRTEKGQISEAEPAIGLTSKTSSDISNHDPTVFWCPDNLNVTSVEENLPPVRVIHGVEYSDVQEDSNLRAEVVELMNSMIEAVLSSSPIIRAPLLQFKLIPQNIDWSSLPQILGDEDIFYDAISTSCDLNLATHTTYDNEDDDQSKIIIEKKIQLKIAEDNLLLISKKASEVATQRKIELVERRRCMEEELGLYKREKLSVLIQSKWRQYRQKCMFFIQLDLHRKKITADKLAKARVTEEKKRKEIQENLRLKALHEKMIAQEIAEREEKKRLEEAKEIEAQAQVEEQLEVERIRMAIEEERIREGLELKEMQIMESESRMAWDLQKRIEDSCVLCKECSVAAVHGHVIRIRRRKIAAPNAMHFEETVHSDYMCEATDGNVAVVEERQRRDDGVEENTDEEGEDGDGVEQKIEGDEQQALILPVELMKNRGKAMICLPARSLFDDMHQPQTQIQAQIQTQGKDVIQALQRESRILCMSDASGIEGGTLCTHSAGEDTYSDAFLPSTGDEHASLICLGEVTINPPSSDRSLPAPMGKAELEILRGVVRMQAVWRGGKSRIRIKTALLAARYHDDELDNLLAYEELNMDETLLSYEEYLAPFALRGGWQFSLSYPVQTENLHGTRMVKALAGGWVAGGLDCSKETSERNYEREGDYDCRDISSSHLIAGPLVYGDHRRRRQSQKGGQSEPLHNYHSFSDGPNTRSSPLGESPMRVSSYSSSSPRVASIEWSNQRPHSAFTETSILLESSAGLLPVLNPSLIIPDEHLTAAKVSPVRRASRNSVSGVRHKSQAYNVSNMSSSVDNRETTMSRGGGGAAGMSSSTGSGRGRGGMGRGGGRHKTGRKAIPPAWALTGPPHGGEGD